MNPLNLITTALEVGLQYGLLVMAVVFSFKILRYPDMSVDGVFALGGAITAITLQSSHSPQLALFLSIAAGAFFGVVTASLNVFFKIDKILSGILIMMALYSVNLKIMGRSNIPIVTSKTLLTPFEGNNAQVFLFFLFVLVIVGTALILFLKTDFGLILRAVGDNPKMVKNNARSIKKYTILGLSISSAIIAAAGSIISQRQGYADVNMGTGIIVICLACMFIGTGIIRSTKLPFLFCGGVLGTFVYELVVTGCLQASLSPSDLKILTVGIVVAVLALQKKDKFLNQKEVTL